MNNFDLFIKDKINIFLVISCFLFSIPLFFSNVYYRDDYWRAVMGDNFWGWDGRQGADYIAHFLSLSNYHVDSYPLGLIIAVTIICSVFIFIKNNFSSKEIPNLGVALPLLFINPFFLQNMAYRFDAPQMVVALSLAILSFYIANGKLKQYFVSFILLFFALTIYQPCANIFLGLMAANICFKIKQGSLDRILSSFIDGFVFTLTYCVYFLVQKIFLNSIGRAEIISAHEVFKSIFSVASYSLEAIVSIFTEYSFFLISLYLIAFMLASCIIIFNFFKKNNFNFLFFLKSGFVFISVPVLLFFSTTGPSFLLSEGVTDVRVLVGFSSVSFFLAIPILVIVKPKFSYLFVLIPVYISCVISFQFSNAIKVQRKFEEFIIYNVASNIQEMKSDKKIYIGGSMPSSPIAKVIGRNQPLVSRIFSPMEEWSIRPAFYGIGYTEVVMSWRNITEEMVAEVCFNNYSPSFEDKHYYIYNYNELILIYFKGGGDIC